MVDEPRLTEQTLRVLGALVDAGAKDVSGAQLGREAKLASGTLYPILLRLESAKWVQSRWEEGDPSELGRPRRRYYRITALGRKRATSTFNELASPPPHS
jgi:PadR family transcriptional regulator PadR